MVLKQRQQSKPFFFLQNAKSLNPIRYSRALQLSCPLRNFQLWSFSIFLLSRKKNVKYKSSRHTNNYGFQLRERSYHSESELYYPDEENVLQENNNLGEQQERQ